MDGSTDGDDAHPMTGAELRCILHSLGLARDQVARLWDVPARTVDRWLYGQRDAPPGIVREVREWQLRADDELAAMLADIDRDPGHIVVTYRDDDGYMAAHPGDRMPSAWHRAIVARAMLARPDVRVDYGP